MQTALERTEVVGQFLRRGGAQAQGFGGGEALPGDDHNGPLKAVTGGLPRRETRPAQARTRITEVAGPEITGGGAQDAAGGRG
ncbi:hypothetical protein SMALA_4894 [Streptomyces malaysiensis subsp. malaysiensis]|nr:hypothetical protein SMALA_4894 [Streptomyces malaysiensis]